MATGLKIERESTEVENKEILKTFQKLDKNGDGKISVDELVKGANILGINPTVEEAADMVNEIDSNGNGFIDYEEFATLMKTQLLQVTQEENVMRSAFKKFDSDDSGFISKENLRRVLGVGKYPLTEEEINQVFEEADIDGDGKIDYNEFVEAFCS